MIAMICDSGSYFTPLHSLRNLSLSLAPKLHAKSDPADAHDYNENYSLNVVRDNTSCDDKSAHYAKDDWVSDPSPVAERTLSLFVLPATNQIDTKNGE